jgi:hypothetical protein
MNITEGQFHKPRPSWIETIWIGFIMCVLIIPLAYMAADALVRELESDERKSIQRIEGLLYPADVTPPKVPTGVKPNYGDLAEPRTRVFQDASRPKGK